MRLFLIILALMWSSVSLSEAVVTPDASQKKTYVTPKQNLIRKHEQEIMTSARILNTLIGAHCPMCAPVTIPLSLGIGAYEVATTAQKNSVIFSNNWVRADQCFAVTNGDESKETGTCKDVLNLVCEEQCNVFRCASPQISEKCQKLCTGSRAKTAKRCITSQNIWVQLNKCGPIGDSNSKCDKGKRKLLCLPSCTGGVGPLSTCADEGIKEKCRQYCPAEQIKQCLKAPPRPSWHRAVQCGEARVALTNKDATPPDAVAATAPDNADNYYTKNKDMCDINLKWACKTMCTKYSCSDWFVKSLCQMMCDVDETAKRNRSRIAKFFKLNEDDKTLREYAGLCLSQPPGCLVK